MKINKSEIKEDVPQGEGRSTWHKPVITLIELKQTLDTKSSGPSEDLLDG